MAVGHAPSGGHPPTRRFNASVAASVMEALSYAPEELSSPPWCGARRSCASRTTHGIRRLLLQTGAEAKS